MIKAILFDLDGTLLNTSYDIWETLSKSLAKFDLPQISIEKTIQYVGDGAKNLIIRAVGDKTEYIERVYNDYIKRFPLCGNRNTTLYEGEESFLLAAKEAGIKLAIITNKPQDATVNVCDQLLSKFNFDIIIGKSDKFPLKPDPSSVEYAINQLKINKADCLFVGDGETDVLTAINADITGVSALWGYRDEYTLKSFGAVNFANSYAELYDYVFKRNRG